MTYLFRFTFSSFLIDIFILSGVAGLISIFLNAGFNEIALPARLFTIFALFFLYLKNYYSVKKFNFFSKDAFLLFEGLLLSYLLTFSIMFVVGMTKSDYYFLISNLFASFAFLYIWKIAFYGFTNKVIPSKKVVLIKSSKITEALVNAIKEKNEFKLKLLDIVSSDKVNIEKSIKLHTPDIIIATSSVIEKIYETIPSKIELIEDLIVYEKLEKKVSIEVIDEDWFKQNFKKPSKFQTILKRTFDVIASIVILLITLPIILLIALAIKFYDNQPVIYTQQRIGKDGKPFKLYKLRTMSIGSDKAGMVDKGNTKDDRIIPFWKFVRKARFDEIPQMINILKGDMSIVGPRVEFIDFVQKYEKDIPFYNYRHFITPGWTGWAQINQGHCVSVENIKEKLKYDFYYIKNNNIFWDLSILLKAVGKALSGRHK